MMNPVHSWNTAEGRLSLYTEQDRHILRLSTRNAEVVDIRVDGDLLKTSSEKIKEVCRHYLPIVRKDSSTGAFSVGFHISTVPDAEPVYESTSGGCLKGMSFGINFSRMEKSILVKSDDEAPDYRQVVQGLNLQGKCQFANCGAYNDTVCIPIGIVKKFSIAEGVTKSFCPACGEKLDYDKVRNLGFWDCQYTIEGNIDGEDVNRSDTTPSDRYKTFTPGDDCVWTYLNITTGPIAASQQADSSGDRCVIF